MRNRQLLCGIGTFALLASASPVMAQTADEAQNEDPQRIHPIVLAQADTGGQADEVAADDRSSATGGSDQGVIVVTAQRREQNLQDVPLAVSAMSADTLQRQEATTSQSLMRLFPNLSGAQVTGAGANNYSMRGLSNAETAATFDSPVATYIDGIYLARINANNFALFDVERIEVLRGPQGTLFGRNTTGGAINIVLRPPSNEFGGYAEAELGNYDHYQLRGSLNIPISDTLRTRFSGYWTEEDGWARNITTGGSNNDHDGWGVRGAISWDIANDLTWDIAADYIHDVNAFIPVSRVDGEWVTRSGLQALGNLVANDKGNIPGNYVSNDSLGLTSTLSLETFWGDIQLITGYRKLWSEVNADYFDGPSAIGGYASVQDSFHEQFTQEVKFTGSAFNDFIDFTAGFYYFYEDNVTDFTTVFALPSGVPFIDADRILYNKAESLAAYAQADFHLTSQLTATVGARWTTERKELHYEDNGNPLAVFPITDALLTDAGIPLHQDATLVTPRFVLQYEPNQDLMFFASATRGFKSGGWNVRATSATLLRDFDPEVVWSYEGGVRSTLFDGLATANLTGFYGDTTDLQIATAAASTPGLAPVFPVGNFSDFLSYGIEFETQINPAYGLSIFGNLGWNKTEYTNPSPEVLAQQAACLEEIQSGAAARPNCGGGIITLDGDIAEPLRAPEWTATLGFSYEIPVAQDWQIVPSGSGRYVSSFNASSAELPNAEDDGYFLLSGSLALESNDGRYRFSIGCENCTDAAYLVSVIGGRTWFSTPRRWFLRAGYRF